MRRTTPPFESRTTTNEDRDSFGAFLAAARLRAGRSLEDIASTTKIAKRFLEALEQGRIERLPEGIYRRAILRTYAAAVGLDPLAAMEKFRQTFENGASREERDAADAAPRPRAAPVRLRGLRVGVLPDPWRSTRSGPVPARYLAAVTAAFAVVCLAQFLLQVDHVESAVSRTAPVDARHPPSPSASRNDEPSIGTGGRGPVASAPPVSATMAEGVEAGAEAAESALVVTSNPAGARVTVDGIGRGITPITIRYLPPGIKTIRVTKDGYLGRERRVDVRGGSQASAVQLTLPPRSPQPGSPIQSVDRGD